MSGLRLMAVHAHPDDESSKGAATMARYVDAGHQVMVVTFTGGERGDILNPAMDIDQIRSNIAQVRREEMAQAARILGIQHRWLGYIDSGFPEDRSAELPQDCFARADINQATESLVQVIREFQPHVMTTYDESGGYPHPDHIRCHQVCVAAFEAAADPAAFPHTGPAWKILKLYYDHGFLKQKFELFQQEFIKHGQTGPFEEFLDHLSGRPDALATRVTTRVECAAYFSQRDEALRAHATQVDPQGYFFAVPMEWQQRLWPTEEFELARARIPVVLPEDDLFAGISPS